MQKVFIKNRRGLKISVLVETAENQKGLAFVMHGLGGYKEQPHLEAITESFKENKYTVVRFALVGHSLGGISTALFAENYPEKVKALAPISTVVSGALSVEAHKRFSPEEFKNWEKTGWLEAKSQSKPGVVKKLKWSHIADRLKYDLLPKVDKLTMPVLLIVGENDTRTPLDHQKILYNVLPGPKELHVIKGSPHTFRDPAHLQELKNILSQWIEKI